METLHLRNILPGSQVPVRYSSTCCWRDDCGPRTKQKYSRCTGLPRHPHSGEHQHQQYRCSIPSVGVSMTEVMFSKPASALILALLMNVVATNAFLAPLSSRHGAVVSSPTTSSKIRPTQVPVRRCCLHSSRRVADTTDGVMPEAQTLSEVRICTTSEGEEMCVAIRKISYFL